MNFPPSLPGSGLGGLTGPPAGAQQGQNGMSAQEMQQVMAVRHTSILSMPQRIEMKLAPSYI